MQNEITKQSNIEIKNRNFIAINGVEKVKNINESMFIGKVAGLNMVIQGQNLELVKLDLGNGEIEIKGTLNSLKYSGNIQSGNIFKRLFK